MPSRSRPQGQPGQTLSEGAGERWGGAEQGLPTLQGKCVPVPLREDGQIGGVDRGAWAASCGQGPQALLPPLPGLAAFKGMLQGGPSAPQNLSPSGPTFSEPLTLPAGSTEKPVSSRRPTGPRTPAGRRLEGREGRLAGPEQLPDGHIPLLDRPKVEGRKARILPAPSARFLQPAAGVGGGRRGAEAGGMSPEGSAHPARTFHRVLCSPPAASE